MHEWFRPNKRLSNFYKTNLIKLGPNNKQIANVHITQEKNSSCTD